MDRESFDATLRTFKHRTPFRPFTVSLVNGERLEVDRPDAFAVRDGVAMFAGPFYGLHEIASLLARAKVLFEIGDNLEFHERQSDMQYADLIRSDSTLVECFEKHRTLHPAEYAPLRPQDIGLPPLVARKART